MKSSSGKYYVSYLLSLLIFGSNGVYAHYISLSSSDIVLLRTLIGGVSLVIIFLIVRHKFTFYKHRKHLLAMVASGISMTGCWLFLFQAYDLIGVGVATVLYYIGPVIIIALSPLMFHEPIKLTTVIGVLIVIAGAVLININEFGSSISREGVICGLLSAVCFAITIICNKRATSITGLENATLQTVIAFFACAVYVGITSGFAMDITPSDWLPILILGVVNTGLGCFLYFMPISKIPAQSISVWGYLEAVSAVIFSMIFLHQMMDLVQIIGAILIIGGAVFSEVSRQRYLARSTENMPKDY